MEIRIVVKNAAGSPVVGANVSALRSVEYGGEKVLKSGTTGGDGSALLAFETYGGSPSLFFRAASGSLVTDSPVIPCLTSGETVDLVLDSAKSRAW